MSIKQDHIGDSNKMVSSIEWLQAIELERDLTLADWNKAKAMHREEIIDANFDGQRLHAKSVTNTMMEDNAEQYYNETFGE